MLNREILDWKQRAQQQEGAHKALATEAKVAIILDHAPDVVKRFLTMTSDRFSYYNQLQVPPCHSGKQCREWHSAKTRDCILVNFYVYFGVAHIVYVRAPIYTSALDRYQ